MRYADGLLTEGEQIVLRTRQHWLALLIRARAGLGLWLLGLVLLGAVVFFNVDPGVGRDVLSVIALVLLALGALIFIYRIWHWWAQDFVVTNRRLLKVTGILNKRSADSSLEKINDAILTQPVLGRILNYGDLEILTAAEMANDMYRMLNSPKEFKKTMLTQKHALETEFQYVGGPPPTPPLRAEKEAAPHERAATAAEPVAPVTAPEAPAAEAPAAEAPAAEAAAPPADASLEITQTLARLADLRDRGAITAEEYDQKKEELLSRL